MTADQLQIGDKVKLKNGNPAGCAFATISEISGATFVLTWKDTAGNTWHDSYARDQVEIAKDQYTGGG